MNNTKMMENMLEKYRYYKSRNIFLEKEKRRLIRDVMENDSGKNSAGLSVISFKTTNWEMKEKTTVYGNESSNNELEKVQDLKIKVIENEISQNNYLVEIIEDSLKMIGEYNERYKILIEGYYIKKIRMEDIAQMTHTSRSRCYELCKEAVACMSKIIFGERLQ